MITLSRCSPNVSVSQCQPVSQSVTGSPITCLGTVLGLTNMQSCKNVLTSLCYFFCLVLAFFWQSPQKSCHCVHCVAHITLIITPVLEAMFQQHHCWQNVAFSTGADSNFLMALVLKCCLIQYFDRFEKQKTLLQLCYRYSYSAIHKFSYLMLLQLISKALTLFCCDLEML